MGTMNISLPDAFRTFLDEQAEEHGFASTSEYVEDLVRREQQREELRRSLLEAASSPQVGPADDAYFDRAHERIRDKAKRRRA
jgi:antitoxin ParD1/3/4